MVALSTSPWHPPTHWKQALFVLEAPLQVKQGDVIKGRVEITRNPTHRRHFAIGFKFRVVPGGGSTESSPEHTAMFKMWR